jgi:hypothetical protein
MSFSHQRFQPAYGATVSEKDVTPETAQQLVDQQLKPPPAAGGDVTEYLSYFNKSADGLNQLLFGKDPRTAAAIKGAMVKNLKESTSKYANVPILGPYFKAQYRKAKAEYAALKAQAETANVSDTLNLALKAGGLVLGVGVLALLAAQVSLSRARTRAVSSEY